MCWAKPASLHSLYGVLPPSEDASGDTIIDDMIAFADGVKIHNPNDRNSHDCHNCLQSNKG